MRTLIISLLTVCAACLSTQKATAAEPAATNGVKWLTIEEAEKLNEKAPRKFLIDVYTDWCGWCKRMDANTFSATEIASYLNTYFYAVKLDAEGKQPVTFGAHTYSANASGRSHELAIAILSGKMSYPSIAYLDETKNLITVVPGYQTPDNLLPILVFINNDQYKTTSWEQFLQEWAKNPQELKK